MSGQSLQDEAEVLRSEINYLQKIIYMNGNIKNFRDFAKLSDNEDIAKKYIPALTDAITQLTDLNQRVHEFAKRAQESNLSRFGHFGRSVANTQKMLDDANSFMNYWTNQYTTLRKQG